MADHSIAWIKTMDEIVSRDQFEKTLMDLAIHGVPKEKIDEMRNNYDNQKEPAREASKDTLKTFGMYVGKKSKTKVINRK